MPQKTNFIFLSKTFAILTICQDLIVWQIVCAGMLVGRQRALRKWGLRRGHHRLGHFLGGLLVGFGLGNYDGCAT